MLVGKFARESNVLPNTFPPKSVYSKSKQSYGHMISSEVMAILSGGLAINEGWSEHKEFLLSTALVAQFLI